MINEETKRMIDLANKKFSEGFLRADASLTASVYSEESIVFPPDSNFVVGKEAIEEFWKGVMISGVKEANLTTLDLLENENFVYERGTGILKIQSKDEKDENVTEQKLKYVVVWKRIGNEWKNLWDIWNSLP
ncbi:MAG TPA: DUF4440 domain-containing protein [Candidatus Sulfotelmatobacter sp.]|jgi:ketosteroid isomerase-like protein|nr:DUF4440 domain-containing protein [Candidatus Sulfotelmatobacter sp.]